MGIGKIFAGIVTFNPQIPRLAENINAIKDQVDKLVIFDNGSENINEVEELCQEYIFLKSDTNRGIAYALNRLMEVGKELGATWVLTLDHDSVVADDIIQSYCSALESLQDNKIVSLTCLYDDRNLENEEIGDLELYSFVERCISSANLIKVSAWEQVGGFNENLFIDEVDHELCYRLANAGYRIVRVNKKLMLHELGEPILVKYLGKDRTMITHSAFRSYYICRNRIYVLRHYQAAHHYDSYMSVINTVVHSILITDNCHEKFFRSLKGVIDGIKMK